MHKLKVYTLVAAILLSGMSLWAQQRRTSPHETVGAAIEGNRVTIVYGRPYSKHPRTGEVRKIWGGLVPAGKVWRTGADEATLLITQRTIVMGGATIPEGVYSLYTLPAEDGSAKLIVNKQVGQWGTQYDESKDVARIDMKKTALTEPVDQFTMAVARGESGGGVIKMSWENTEYSVPFTVQK